MLVLDSPGCWRHRSCKSRIYHSYRKALWRLFEFDFEEICDGKSNGVKNDGRKRRREAEQEEVRRIIYIRYFSYVTMSRQLIHM